MLTYIKTPRILFSYVFLPVSFDSGLAKTDTRWSMTFEVTPDEEKVLPDYLAVKVRDADWHGMDKGIRSLTIGAGKPPPVFGLPVGISRSAFEHNLPMDALLRGQPARLAVTSFERKTVHNRRGKQFEGDTGIWGVLRAVEMLGVNDTMASFDSYITTNQDSWEFK